MVISNHLEIEKMLNTNEPPAIQVKNLSAVFRSGNGGLRALDEVSFDVQHQEFLCVLGPSGSGKSTLLRILAGLLPPTSRSGVVCGFTPFGTQSGSWFRISEGEPDAVAFGVGKHHPASGN